MKKVKKIPITVLLATKNEAINLPKCLLSLAPASQIIVLDSQSIDNSLAIARRSGAKVVEFNYRGGYPKKRQWALEHLKIKTPWVLLIDADEEVPLDLWAEIRTVLESNVSADAYFIRKEFHFLGKKFHFGGFSFSAILLFKKGTAHFERLIDDPTDMDMEVHERLIVDGLIGKLKTPLIHNDFKNLEAYLARHNKYSTWEANLRNSFLEKSKYGADSIKPKLFGNPQERRRFLKLIAVRIPFESCLWFAYHYFLRLGFLEGRRGFIACQIRAQYISQVRSKIYELRLKQ